MDSVDEDKSGQIEFEEFLMIIKNSDNNQKSERIIKFFKDYASGRLGSGHIPFSLIVQNLRHQYMMDAILSKDRQKRQWGMKILNNVSENLKFKKI